MSYYPIKKAILKGDLEKAKRLAELTANPILELGLAIKDAGVVVTLDDPSNPKARWGKITGCTPFSVRIGRIGRGSPFDIKGIKRLIDVLLPEGRS